MDRQPGETVVRRARWIAVVLIVLVAARTNLSAHPLRSQIAFRRAEKGLHGQLLDFTHNHGADRRLWSPALCEKRDMYVYLPPGYDACRQYPLIVFLHGFAQDEGVFLRIALPMLDQAMADGHLPPAIIAAPDASIRGGDCFFGPSSFFLNTRAGAFEDYLMIDVWNFLMTHYSIRPEPQAHVLFGVSMGGGAAFNKIIKFPDQFRIAIGIFPPLNLRWMDCHGHYRRNFDPCCWGWRTDFSRSREVVARFGPVAIRLGKLVNPLYGRKNPETVDEVSRENPIEMLDAYDVRPGCLQMYIAYGGRDQFNIDAQVESFLFVARQRCLPIGVGYEPKGTHGIRTARKLFPGTIEWLAPRLAPYAPCAHP
jgi:pimeloyl-ACP methyl ester carboxylesterase